MISDDSIQAGFNKLSEENDNSNQSLFDNYEIKYPYFYDGKCKHTSVKDLENVKCEYPEYFEELKLVKFCDRINNTISYTYDLSKRYDNSKIINFSICDLPEIFTFAKYLIDINYIPKYSANYDWNISNNKNVYEDFVIKTKYAYIIIRYETITIMAVDDLYISNEDSNYIQFLYELIECFLVSKNIKQKNSIFVVSSSPSGFEKNRFDLNEFNVNIDDCYDDEFSEVYDRLILKLSDRKCNGLTILSGEPGTGKSTLIRKIAGELKKNIIFIPPGMINFITDPSFIPFLKDNPNSILIIEDAEPALSRNGDRNNATSNLLNITDGLLSDCLNISIICTVNVKISSLDDALMRKGRLLESYTFGKLSVDKTKLLIKKLYNIDYVESKGLTIGDIYNYNVKYSNVSDKVNNNKIGFGK